MQTRQDAGGTLPESARHARRDRGEKEFHRPIPLMTTRRTRRRKWGWKGLALVLVLLAGFYFSRGFFQRFRKTYPPTAFYQVKRADMLISVVEEGALRALNETVVRSGLEGFNRIIQLAPEGSYVQKGELLVELDSSGLEGAFE